MLSSETVESIKNLLNGRTYHLKPPCPTLPSDIFNLTKSKWEGLSMYFSFCYMFMWSYISLTKGKLFPGLVILCNVGTEGQLKQSPEPKCYWYFMHECKGPVTSLLCSFGGDKMPVFLFCFSFCAHWISKIKHSRGTFLPDCFSCFWRILPAAGQQARWNQTCLSPKNFNQNKVRWDGKMSKWAK